MASRGLCCSSKYQRARGPEGQVTILFLEPSVVCPSKSSSESPSFLICR